MRVSSCAHLCAHAALLVSSALGLPAQESPASQPHGQVIFSRSTDANGRTVTRAGQSAPPAVRTDAAPVATDAERQAVTTTDFDMDLRLRTAESHIAVRALLTVRNDGSAPLAHIPLQLSSSLNWERIRLRGKDVPFTVATLNADCDHTGQLHEAAIALPQPLAPGASLQFDLAYSGAVAVSAQRLVAIGTPQEAALHSDWDGVGAEFTGLRGFGNVIWYPVSAPPVILGDGSRLFDEIGEQKRRLAGAHFRLRLTAEFPHGQPPTVALVNGRTAPLAITDRMMAGEEVAGVATADSGVTTLGFETPSLFLARRKAVEAQNVTLWALPENEAAAPAWTAAAAAVTPFLQRWLGQRPRAPLTILDLPDAGDAPFETGALLVTGILPAAPDQLNGVLAHALTHAWMISPRAWLSEGVAHFMGTLWTERQQGRDQALRALELGRPALALAEPESPGQSQGQPLDQAISPVYYRTKADYILWMLRDAAGDDALSAALRAYDPVADAPIQTPGGVSAPSQFEKLLEQSGPRSDLSAFFKEWIETDKGLPDLAIDGAFPSQASAGNWLVAVNLSNNGYVSAEVPVTVRNESASVTQRVLVPARSKVVARILIQGKPAEVQANDGTVPETQASVHVLKLDENK
jgi:hypothetical protein